MRKKKLRKFVLPSLFVAGTLSIFFGAAALNNALLSEEMNYDYSKSLMKNVTEATLSEQKETTDVIIKPYVADDVEVLVSYYDKDLSDEEKEKSLIVYENTYMPSSGSFYGSNNVFDVVAVMDGKVTDIKEDNILGTYVEVTHNTNLISYYYSLKDVPVNVGTMVKAGTIIGRSNTNKIFEDKNNILFEVYYQGKSINPEKFYAMQKTDLQWYFVYQRK